MYNLLVVLVINQLREPWGTLQARILRFSHGEIGFAQLKLNCFEYLRYAIIDKICQNAVVLHVELGNIICLLPLIERASLGWDHWDLVGFCGVRFGLPQSRFFVREEQHAICTTSDEKEQRLTVQH